MGELLDFVRSASEKLGIPSEILTGLPVVELTGDSAVMIEQHHGFPPTRRNRFVLMSILGCSVLKVPG